MNTEIRNKKEINQLQALSQYLVTHSAVNIFSSIILLTLSPSQEDLQLGLLEYIAL